MTYCRYCGKETESDSIYCSQCGKDLRSQLDTNIPPPPNPSHNNETAKAKQPFLDKNLRSVGIVLLISIILIGTGSYVATTYGVWLAGGDCPVPLGSGLSPNEITQNHVCSQVGLFSPHFGTFSACKQFLLSQNLTESQPDYFTFPFYVHAYVTCFQSVQDTSGVVLSYLGGFVFAITLVVGLIFVVRRVISR